MPGGANLRYSLIPGGAQRTTVAARVLSCKWSPVVCHSQLPGQKLFVPISIRPLWIQQTSLDGSLPVHVLRLILLLELSPSKEPILFRDGVDDQFRLSCFLHHSRQNGIE